MDEEKQFRIVISRKLIRRISKLPKNIQSKFDYLTEDLREKGPIAHNWPNYSKLEKDKYHCHLSYSYVACWTHEEKTIIIEVYYVGSRENAPY